MLWFEFLTSAPCFWVVLICEHSDRVLCVINGMYNILSSEASSITVSCKALWIELSQYSFCFYIYLFVPCFVDTYLHLNEYVSTEKDTQFSLGRPASFNTARTYLSTDFATEEQAARMIGQMVTLMHRWLHIESYEICTEKVDGEYGEGGVKKGDGIKVMSTKERIRVILLCSDRAGLSSMP